MLTEWLYENPHFVYLIWLLGHAITCRFMVLSERDYQSQSQIGFEYNQSFGSTLGDFLKMALADSLIMVALIALGAHYFEEYAFAVLSGAIFVPYGANVMEHFENVALFRVLAERPKRGEPLLIINREECHQICAKKCVGYAVFLFFLFGITSNPLVLGGGIGILCWGGLHKLESWDLSELN